MFSSAHSFRNLALLYATILINLLTYNTIKSIVIQGIVKELLMLGIDQYVAKDTVFRSTPTFGSERFTLLYVICMD